jgi:hypothetical protein
MPTRTETLTTIRIPRFTATWTYDPSSGAWVGPTAMGITRTVKSAVLVVDATKRTKPVYRWGRPGTNYWREVDADLVEVSDAD